MSPDPFDDWLERVARGFEREDIGGKGVFRTNRLADPAGSNWPFVDSARNPVIRALASRSAAEGRKVAAL
jgi:hypothetical protein